MNRPLRAGALTRAQAARAVAAVIGAGRTLDEALQDAVATVAGDSDRAQVRALAYGALRGHHRHRLLLGQLLARPLPRKAALTEALLSVGCYQLLDEEQPDYAAVAATVEAARVLGLWRLTGLVNATLRRLQRERAGLLAAVDATPEGQYSHPAWLVARLRADRPAAWRAVLAANQEPPPLWLRVNRLRTSREAWCARLTAAGIAHDLSADCPQAVRLALPRPVTAIPGFDAGEVTVQDLAAQLAGHLLDLRPGLRVLDACAAPGGKATHLLELADGTLDLLALDLDAARLQRLAANLERLGLRAATRAADAAQPATWWDGVPFDRILLDAPCSGTGVIRRHPDIKLLRRDRDIAALADRQFALLEALWPLLRPGGVLLYVTCSVLEAENEAVVRRFLAVRPEARLAESPWPLPAWAAPRPGGGALALPGAAGPDGFYYALMTRDRS